MNELTILVQIRQYYEKLDKPSIVDKLDILIEKSLQDAINLMTDSSITEM